MTYLRRNGAPSWTKFGQGQVISSLWPNFLDLWNGWGSFSGALAELVTPWNQIITRSEYSDSQMLAAGCYMLLKGHNTPPPHAFKTQIH
jgi:hypothetical protein